MTLNLDQFQFQSPTPGMSLTTEPKGRPWERPAKYSTPDEAFEFYINKLTIPRRVAQMLEILENVYPATSLVDSIILGGVMQGLHSLDVAIIIAPALFELITGVADTTGLEYEEGLVDKNELEDASLVARAIKSSKKAEEFKKTIEDEDIAQVEQAVSLMAKPVSLREEEPEE